MEITQGEVVQMKPLPIFRILVLFMTTLSYQVSAETLFELTAGVGQFALDVDQKRGQQIEDNSTALNFSAAAYRASSDVSYWGAVFEISSGISRDENLPGSGRLIGFRFADYLRKLNDHSSIEVYAGLAQFDWIKKANGYYFGVNYRYALFTEGSGLMIESKYYQDLAYDSPQGDDIVDGFQTSIKYFYQF